MNNKAVCRTAPATAGLFIIIVIFTFNERYRLQDSKKNSGQKIINIFLKVKSLFNSFWIKDGKISHFATQFYSLSFFPVLSEVKVYLIFQERS